MSSTNRSTGKGRMPTKDILELGIKLIALCSVLFAYFGYRQSVKKHQIQISLDAIHASKDLGFQQALNRILTLEVCREADSLSLDCLAIIYGDVTDRELIHTEKESLKITLSNNQLENDFLFALTDDMRLVVNHYDYCSILYKQNLGLLDLIEESLCDDIGLLLQSISLLPQKFKKGLSTQRIAEFRKHCE